MKRGMIESKTPSKMEVGKGVLKVMGGLLAGGITLITVFDKITNKVLEDKEKEDNKDAK